MIIRRKILQESLSYTIKNFVDTLDAITDYDEVYMVYNKIKKVKTEFDKHYLWNDKIEKEILGIIIDYDNNMENSLEALNVQKMDQFNHLKLRLKLSYNHKILKQFDRYRIYSFMYRIFVDGIIPNRFTAYTLPEIVDNKYLIFITFDENSIKNFQLVTTQNSYDLSSPVFLTDLNIIEINKLLKKRKK